LQNKYNATQVRSSIREEAQKLEQQEDSKSTTPAKKTEKCFPAPAKEHET